MDDDPEAVEGMGVAHGWLDHADQTIGARERAHRLYRGRGDSVGAARVASALAWDSILFGGRTAVARGWLDRAARLRLGGGGDAIAIPATYTEAVAVTR